MISEVVKMPWSKSSIRRLSESIRDGIAPDPVLPTYDEVTVWFDDLGARVQNEIRAIDFVPILGTTVPEIASRTKTIDTLRDKLRRRPPDLHINTVRDIAGVRFEAEMTIEQQDQVVQVIVEAFQSDRARVRDMRSDAHSGYRAVHIWLELPARVEIQVRTHLQGKWANLYESMADVYGRGIRYGDMPEDPADRAAAVLAQRVSVETIALVESTVIELAHSRAVFEGMRESYQALRPALRLRSRLLKRRIRKEIGSLEAQLSEHEAQMRERETTLIQMMDLLMATYEARAKELLL